MFKNVPKSTRQVVHALTTSAEGVVISSERSNRGAKPTSVHGQTRTLLCAQFELLQVFAGVCGCARKEFHIEQLFNLNSVSSFVAGLLANVLHLPPPCYASTLYKHFRFYYIFIHLMAIFFLFIHFVPTCFRGSCLGFITRLGFLCPILRSGTMQSSQFQQE